MNKINTLTVVLKLSIRATLVCLQGGRCEEVQLMSKP